MGINTDGTLFETTGEEKIQARGAGVVRDMMKGMKRDDVVGSDGFLKNGTSAIKGAKMIAGTGRVVIIKPGFRGVGAVLLTAYSIGASVGVGFEGCAKMQNNGMLA